jgi:hypothetical protein
MPSAFRDPKSLADWIQLDYFRRPRGLRRWRGWLGWGTLAVCAVAVAAVMAVPRGRTAFQAGPVSAAHSLFHDDCGRCHKDAFQTARRLWATSDDVVHAVPDFACEDCHVGPPHNDKQLKPKNCADCHREHRGRAALSFVSDDHCTGCHADLKANSKSAETTFQNVTRFPDGHPAFRLEREQTDPGQLRFNHEVHVTPKGVLVPGGTTEVLDCSKCHELDPARRYMKPISYMDHCQRCHPLAVQLTSPFKDKRAQAAAEEFAKEPAPHKEPAVVRAVLRDRLLRFARDNPVVAAPLDTDRGIPRPRRLEAIKEQQWLWAKRQLTETEKMLFNDTQLPHNEGLLFDRAGGCSLCHIPASPRGAVPRGPDDLPKYEPTQLPQRWLTHSRFGHDSHRLLACEPCHAKAPQSRLTSDVLIPTDVKLCAGCHNARTGVRNDCVECHDYHHRGPDYKQTMGHTIAEALGEK